MELFDDIITEISRQLAALSTADLARQGASSAPWKDVGEHHMILAREMAYELGGSGTLGLSGCLCTTGALPFATGVYRYGEDLLQISRDRSYARIVLLQIGENKDGDVGKDIVRDKDDHKENKDAARTVSAQESLYRRLQEIDRVRYQIHPAGYMARISPISQREPVRISRSALKDKISFARIGQMYLEQYQKIPCAKDAAVIFITDARFDYMALDRMLRRAEQITQSLYHIFDGLDMDCGACGLRSICDEVEGLRQLHFGMSGAISAGVAADISDS